MRFRLLLLSLVLGAALAPGVAAGAAAQRAGSAPRGPRGSTPTPFDQGAAAAAGDQARAPGATATVPATAAAPQGIPTIAVTRVFATQYDPNTPGSAEVAVPDKCAKFAALGQMSTLRSFGCPAGYNLGLDYRVLVVRDSGQYGVFPVKDVGPWNIDDNYWDFGPGTPRPRRLFADLPPGRPESQSAFSDGYNPVSNCKNLDGSASGRTAGADQFGRCVLNPAGIDLSVKAAAQLGLGNLQNEWVTVAFVWAPLRTNIASVRSGYFVDVRSGSLDSGAALIQWPAHGGSNQQWRFIPVGGDEYALVSMSSGKVVDVAGGSLADGAQLVQWPWHGGPNQRWRLEPVGENEFRVISVMSGKVMDVAGASPDAGAPLVQYTWHGGPGQRWRLYVVGTG